MPEPNSIGVPTARSMGSAFGDYGVGLAGGLIFYLVQSFLGSGFLGSLAAPIAAGSFLKGTRGTVIATMAGFQAAASLISGGLGGIFGGSTSTSNGTSQEVM